MLPLAWLALLAPTGGCSMLRPTAFEGRVALPADAAAWVAASLARQWHPAADPLPQHLGAPAVRHRDGTYTVRYAMAPRGGARVALNGRLLPPRLDTPARWSREPLRQPSTVWADATRIEVWATSDGSHWSISGGALPSGAVRELKEAMAFASATFDSRADVCLDGAPVGTGTAAHLRQLARERIVRASARDPGGPDAFVRARAVLAAAPQWQATDSELAQTTASMAQLRGRGAEARRLWADVATHDGRAWTRAWARGIGRSLDASLGAAPGERARQLRLQAAQWSARGFGQLSERMLQRAREVANDPTADATARLFIELGRDDLEAATGAALVLVREGRPGALHAAAEVWSARGCPTLAARMSRGGEGHTQPVAASPAPRPAGAATAENPAPEGPLAGSPVAESAFAASPANGPAASESPATAALRARAARWFAQTGIAADGQRPITPALAAPPR